MTGEWIRNSNGLTSFALSHQGCKRTNNEDNLAQDGDLHLWAVADGMGGHSHGEIASRVALDTLLAQRRAGTSLSDAIAEANRLVSAQNLTPQSNMGTTLVALEFQPDGSTWHAAWVGDSRIYHWRDGVLTQITRDHTLANDLVENGLLSEEEANVHPMRHRLTRALGGSAADTSADVEVDELEGKSAPGDRFLLCSDGLSGVLSHDQLTFILDPERGAIDTAAHRMLQLTLQAGAPDNVTMIIVECGARGAER